MPDTIETPRLTLRPYVPADARAVAVQIGVYDVAQWLTHVPHPYSEADAHAFFVEVADDPLVLAVLHDDDLVGCVSIIGGDLGYWYGAAHWGQGFATEAARALLDRYFETGHDSVTSGYLEGNDGSRNVLEKLGFEHTEVISTYAKSRRCEVPNHRMVLSKARWERAT
ncbi:MAG: GNAT family N-acetyltransferase [Pseudomonadota bacterium]